MNQLMLNLPDLQHLELVTKGLLDMTDGQSWEEMTHSLLTFNFKISVCMDWIEDIVESFRTPFWLEEKRWFVACTWDGLYSVPYFSDVCTNTSFRPPLYSSVTDKALFCDHINHFILNESPKQIRYYFRHMKKLEIASSESLEMLSVFIDMNSIECLVVSTLIELSKILWMFQLMPRLKKLSINTQVSYFLQESHKIRLECIENLEINDPLLNNDYYVVEQLCQTFPCVETLCISSLKWAELIPRVIERLKNLSNVTIYFEKLASPQQPNQLQEIGTRYIQTIADEARHLKHATYLDRHYWSSDENQTSWFCYHCWIQRKVPEAFYQKHWPLQRGYNYYRIDHFLQRNFFLKLLRPFVFQPSLEFSVCYAMLSPFGRWYAPLIQFVVLVLCSLIPGSYIDLFSINVAQLLGMYLGGLVDYTDRLKLVEISDAAYFHFEKSRVTELLYDSPPVTRTLPEVSLVVVLREGVAASVAEGVHCPVSGSHISELSKLPVYQ
ncbi:unnamed protein product [Rotaria socialis]